MSFVGMALGILCLCVPLACQDTFDANQVQVVTEPSAFQSFPLPPCNIAYGPYAMITPDKTCIIAWEEQMRGEDRRRHVEVPFKELAPATQYFYRVNGAKNDGRFLTAPADDSPFTFLLWSDSRTGTKVAAAIARQMINLAPEASFALHAGDFVIDGNREDRWEKEWWVPMRDLLLHCPIYPTMGNHEEDSAFYYRYFSSLGGNGVNYSFDWGDAHFVVCKIDEGDSEQLAWLEEDLADNRNAGFTVVCHHEPPFSSTPSDTGGIQYLQDSVVPLFEKYGVDLVIGGDIHSYQHHFRNNVHYLTSAGGGEKPLDFGLPLAEMTLTMLKSYNFSRCRLEHNRMSVTTYNEAGEIIDSFEILPQNPPVITSEIGVETSALRINPGEQCRVTLYLNRVEDLDEICLTMKYAKDTPAVRLEVIDSDPATEGVQIEPGELRGTIQANRADNQIGVLEYREQGIKGLNGEKIKIASAVLAIPEDSRVTAIYLVPQVTLFDTSGEEIPHFMGGAKIVIAKE